VVLFRILPDLQLVSIKFVLRGKISDFAVYLKKRKVLVLIFRDFWFTWKLKNVELHIFIFQLKDLKFYSRN